MGTFDNEMTLWFNIQLPLEAVLVVLCQILVMAFHILSLLAKSAQYGSCVCLWLWVLSLARCHCVYAFTSNTNLVQWTVSIHTHTLSDGVQCIYLSSKRMAPILLALFSVIKYVRNWLHVLRTRHRHTTHTFIYRLSLLLDIWPFLHIFCSRPGLTHSTMSCDRARAILLANGTARPKFAPCILG